MAYPGSFEFPRSPSGDFGPPGSGRPLPPGSRSERDRLTTTDSRYELSNLVRDSSTEPQTPTRAPRHPTRFLNKASLAVRSADLVSPSVAQFSVQASPYPNANVPFPHISHIGRSVNEQLGTRAIYQDSFATRLSPLPVRHPSNPDSAKENKEPRLSSDRPHRNAPSSPLSGVIAAGEGSYQQRLPPMASNRMLASSRDEQSHLPQLLEAAEQLGQSSIREAHLKQKCEKYKSKIGNLKEKIKELEELYAKAQRTIQVQSDELSGKSEHNKIHTPHRQRGAHPQTSSFGSTPAHRQNYVPDYRVPSFFNQQPSASQIARQPVPLQRQGSSNMSNITHYGNIAGSQFMTTDNYSNIASQAYSRAPQPQSIPPSFYDATAIAPYRQPSSVERDFKKMFNEFFGLVEIWAQNWASVPNPELDENLPIKLKGLIASVCDKSLALPLLRDPATRYFVVARVLNEQFTSRMKIAYLKGFNPDLDRRIQSARASHRPNIPLDVRKAIVAELSDVARAVSLDEKHMAYLFGECHSSAMEMMNQFAPLMGGGTNQGYGELLEVTKHAMLLTMCMLTANVEWKIEFPKIGDIYISQSMTNRDPWIQGEATGLTHMRVKLGITPLIIRRDQSRQSVISTQEHMGHVLLMQ